LGDPHLFGFEQMVNAIQARWDRRSIAWIDRARL